MSENEHTVENDATCPWCDYTAEDCRIARSGGCIACCPDCDHRVIPPAMGDDERGPA